MKRTSMDNSAVSPALHDFTDGEECRQERSGLVQTGEALFDATAIDHCSLRETIAIADAVISCGTVQR